MVAADGHRVPLRQLLVTIGHHVGHQPQRRPRRINVGAARDVLLQNVVLHRAGQPPRLRPLAPGRRHVQRQQNGGRRVDGHRGGNLLQGDAFEQKLHVLQGINGHSHATHFPACLPVVGVVPYLRRQVESHRQAGLALREQVAEAPIRFRSGPEAGILPHRPQPAAVHRGVDPTGVRKLARATQVALGIDLDRILGGVERLELDVGAGFKLVFSLREGFLLGGRVSSHHRSFLALYGSRGRSSRASRRPRLVLPLDTGF